MSTNRRQFLKVGTFAAVAAAIPLRALSIGARANDDSSVDRSTRFPRNGLGNYSKAAFASCLNSTFRLNAGYRTVDVKLVEVADVTPEGMITKQGAECFSLRFAGARLALPQNTYGVDHPVLGSFPLFLVPAGKDKGTHGFAAIVNLLSERDAAAPVPTRAARLREK